MVIRYLTHCNQYFFYNQLVLFQPLKTSNFVALDLDGDGYDFLIMNREKFMAHSLEKMFISSPITNEIGRPPNPASLQRVGVSTKFLGNPLDPKDAP